MQPATVKFMGASGWYTAKHFFPSCRKGGSSWVAQRMNSHHPPHQALKSPFARTMWDHCTFPSGLWLLQAGKDLPKHSKAQPHYAGLTVDLSGHCVTGGAVPTTPVSSCLHFLASARDCPHQRMPVSLFQSTQHPS